MLAAQARHSPGSSSADSLAAAEPAACDTTPRHQAASPAPKRSSQAASSPASSCSRASTSGESAPAALREIQRPSIGSADGMPVSEGAGWGGWRGGAARTPLSRPCRERGTGRERQQGRQAGAPVIRVAVDRVAHRLERRLHRKMGRQQGRRQPWYAWRGRRDSPAPCTHLGVVGARARGAQHLCLQVKQRGRCGCQVAGAVCGVKLLVQVAAQGGGCRGAAGQADSCCGAPTRPRGGRRRVQHASQRPACSPHCQPTAPLHDQLAVLKDCQFL